MGTKCHIKPKFKYLQKKAEIEILYESLLRLQENNKVTVHENLQPQLLAESTKRRDFDKSNILTPDLRKAATELKNHEQIIVLKADKSNAYVVLDKTEYKEKLDTILGDTTKFKSISRNPVSDLKIQVNKLIKTANQQNGHKLFTPIIGEYKPGYIYGTVKTHKDRNPLRPIISLFIIQLCSNQFNTLR